MKVRCPSVGENGDAGYVEVDQVKLFRNLPGIRFEGRIHEQVLMPIRRAGGTAAWTDIFVVHANADLSPERRAKKTELDLRILQLDHAERPDHPFVLFNLGMTLAEAGNLVATVVPPVVASRKQQQVSSNSRTTLSFGSAKPRCFATSAIFPTPRGPTKTCWRWETETRRRKREGGKRGRESFVRSTLRAVPAKDSRPRFFSHLRKTYALLVSSYRQLGRHVTAWETCLKGLKQFPDDPELRFRQASMLRDTGNLPDAARAFEDLLALQNGRHLSSVDRGIKGYRTRHILAGIYAELGDFAKAEALWRHVLQEAPSFRLPWRALGDMLVRRGNAEGALQLVQQMETSSGAPGLLLDARVLRADALASLSNTALARDELDIAIQSNPDDLDLLERRCRLVFEHFPPAATEPAFRDLLARDPQNAAAQHNLGSILYKLARHDDSVAAYRESLRCRPNTASTYTHLGYALRAAGYRADAIAACQEALKLVPGDLAATEALRQVQATD